MNKGLKVRRGAGSFNKSVMFVTAPSGSTVTMQNMVRSDNLATDVQYQEASAKDQSCVTITQCGEVSKGDRVKVSLEVTASKDAVGYWAFESGLITDKREVNLKSGKQTVTLDITASGNLSLDTKFFCKGDDSDATITAANLQLYKYTVGTTIKTATEKNGVWRFNGLDLGLWLIKAEKDDQTPATQKFEIKEFGVYRTSLAFSLSAADFVWGGTKGTDYEIFQDDETVIPEGDYQKYTNWKARIYTSITVIPNRDGDIDAFLLGAGASGSSRESGGDNYGAGGGSGYTKTLKNIQLTANTQYQIEIGSGGRSVSDNADGVDGKKGGSTSAFENTAEGGNQSIIIETYASGGDGGSGGAGNGGRPGTDGSDGTGERPGRGQGTTTREFGEPSGKLYADGGKFGQSSPAKAVPNSGNGGDGAQGGASGPGSSGIVVIRNAREVA